MTYIENPKTKGSGILCAIPQVGLCSNRCEECFFQSGWSYLEPLSANLPNAPTPEQARGYVVRVNDGNDSNVQRDLVISSTDCYQDRFFNTAIPRALESFPGPVVLTVNPGKFTDNTFYSLDPIPPNLMFVRIRANTWNMPNVGKRAIDYYTSRGVCVVLTFMAYHSAKSIPVPYRVDYLLRKRTLNSYFAITTDAWRKIMRRHEDNILVRSCGFEGERGKTACRLCGNCLREFYATRERMKSNAD